MNGGWLISAPKPPAGYYRIGGPGGGLHFALNERPRWLARLMCRWLLQWVWIDGPMP